MPTIISPTLWFDGRASEAAQFYTSIFKDSAILSTQYYTEAGKSAHGQDAGTVMLVTFRILGQEFTALNGGPMFKFNEAISFQIKCEDQEEVDYFWEKLKDGGDEGKQRCGWVCDKFGVSWQVVPNALEEIMTAADGEGKKRAMEAMLKMKKLDIAGLRAAAEEKAKE